MKCLLNSPPLSHQGLVLALFSFLLFLFLPFMFYGPCLGERGLVRDLWRFTVKFSSYQREHLTNLQSDMKGRFIEALFQEGKKTPAVSKV